MSTPTQISPKKYLKSSHNTTRRILGIDPGSRITGFGVITQKGNELVHLHSGCIRLKEKAPLDQRLFQLHEELNLIIESTQPDIMALESIFYAKNVRSTVALAHARGVIMLAAAQAGLEVVQYAPTDVKQSVVGSGRATKEQVMTMICHLFRIPLDVKNQPYDVSDALAVALTHLNVESTQRRITQSISPEQVAEA